MSNTIITEGKTTTEAIEKGLKELNCKREDIEYKVLESQEKRSFFSILEPRVVKVEISLKNKVEENIKKEKIHKEVDKIDIDKCKSNLENFLNEFIKEIKNINYQIKIDNNNIYINLLGEKANDLIGHRGETIKALQNLLFSIGNKNVENRVNVIVDIADYKSKRENTLKELARKLEKTVLKTGKKIILEPMSAYERKIIHTELQNSKIVTTYSIGEEPRRKIVINKK